MRLATALEVLLSAVLAIIPADSLPRDGVERLELNHFYDERGQLVFTQLVGWETDDRCRFWRMCKTETLRPTRDHEHGGWLLTWVDGERPRQVRAASFDETWTQWDVEVLDRNYLPAERRRPLKGK